MVYILPPPIISQYGLSANSFKFGKANRLRNVGLRGNGEKNGVQNARFAVEREDFLWQMPITALLEGESFCSITNSERFNIKT